MEILERLGPRVLQSVRDHLQLPPDRRGEERLEWVDGVQVRPMLRENEIGEVIAAQTRDIALGGFGLELPCRLPCEFLLLQLSLPQRAPLTVPLQVLHSQPLGDGRHVVGARFAWELVRDSSS
jgi:hypothetical protein